jgi:hypothetical protein
MDNLKIREFQIALDDYISKTEIPLEVKRIVVATLLVKLEKETNEQLLIEIEERNKEVTQNAKSV